MIRSELATYELRAAKRIVVVVIYRRKTRLPTTAQTFLRIVVHASGVRRSGGKDSSSRNDQRNTTTANNGGVRKTICHDATDIMAIPKNGAKIGVNKKIVKISDMVCAIRSPTKRSRTPAMVVMKTAD